MSDDFQKYSNIEFWLNLLFQRGALAVAEVAGTVMLFRAVVSPTFPLEIAVFGASLVSLGVIVEYLIWTKTTVFVSRRVEQLDSLRKKIADEQTQLIAAVVNGRPLGAAGEIPKN